MTAVLDPPVPAKPATRPLAAVIAAVGVPTFMVTLDNLVVSTALPVIRTDLGASLAAGNACVVKPAEDACLSLLRLAELAAEAGLPPGVLNVVTGLGSEAGAALAAHEGIAHMSFTGSPATGASAIAARRRSASRTARSCSCAPRSRRSRPRSRTRSRSRTSTRSRTARAAFRGSSSSSG